MEASDAPAIEDSSEETGQKEDSETEGKAKEEGAKEGYFPDRPLPRDKDGKPIPESDTEHSQLGKKKGRKGEYGQAREFGKNGELVRDLDFTDHGRPKAHTNPHEHEYIPNETGGTPKRGPAQPLNTEVSN